ncbi:hypothetical protein TrVE_jg7778 [Triparma verrucosa]|uniref:Thioredoxin domain-containing protein n=1 Tax=Triparma verrucosa TaxID=1606542 RepID=A0A9W7EUD7_9STRA|nr:hypothetical protein TrVE_jg7778 [Triparma verrucosa]
MNNFLGVLLVSAILLGLSASSVSAENSYIYLSDSNFTKVSSSSSSPLFVFFYAPWCGHCAKFHPVFVEFSASYSSGDAEEDKVTFVKVDAEHRESAALAKMYNIVSYPTILYFPPHSTPSTVPTSFSYPSKSPESLSLFIDQSRVGPKFIPLSSEEPYASAATFERSRLVITLKSENKKTIKKVEKLIAGVQADEIVKYMSPNFFHAKTAAVDVGPDCSECIEIWNKDTAKKTVKLMSEFDSKGAEDVFKTILVAAAKPYVTYTQGFFSRCQVSSVIKKFAVIFEKQFKITDEFKELDFGTDVVPVWVDPVEYREVAEMYKVIEEKAEGEAQWKAMPEVLLIDVSGKRGSQVTKVVGGPVESSQLNEVVHSCLVEESENCTAKPRARSDKARKSYSQEKPIQRIVGKTIKRNILTSTKDQFVFFYNEGDPEWKAMREQYASIAARFQVEETLEFLEIDLAKNDIPLKFVEILSTPVLYFFPANDKTKPIYFGSRGSQFNNEEILQWLRKVVTLPFRGSFDSQYYVGFVGRTKHQMKIYKESSSFKDWWKQFWEKKLTVLERMELEEKEKEKEKEKEEL